MELTKEKHDKIIQLLLALKYLPNIDNHTLFNILTIPDLKAKLLAVNNYDYQFLTTLSNDKLQSHLPKSQTAWYQYLAKAKECQALIKKEKLTVLYPYLPNYPRRLLQLEYYPPLLFVKGNVNLLNSSKIIGVIGAKKITKLGEKLCQHFVQNYVSRGYVTLGGLALGADTIGHKATLMARGKAIVVLPTAVDMPVYPWQNDQLARDIVKQGGALVSEYLPRSKVNNASLISQLVARAEWQAGLSDGILATETDLAGDTNHTIHYAINENKPIGMFDYQSSRFKEDFLTNDHFAGNLFYLKQKQAIPIYSAQSLDKLDQAIIKKQKAS